MGLGIKVVVEFINLAFDTKYSAFSAVMSLFSQIIVSHSVVMIALVRISPLTITVH